MSDIGDRMKEYESVETHRKLIPLLPVYVRLDGKAFKTFTRGMDKPFDEKMSQCMIETTRRLVGETNSCIGYTQSDEINLVVEHGEDSFRQFSHGPYFSNKVFKLTSILAGMASSIFLSNYIKIFDIDIYSIKVLPSFDCRVINLPTKTEVSNMILWRNSDATKNSISSAACMFYTTKELLHKSGSERQEMLFSKGINFNDYPEHFKRGTFLKKVWVKGLIDKEVWDQIPEDRRPVSREIERMVIGIFSMPIFSKVVNREDVIFKGSNPIEIKKK